MRITDLWLIFVESDDALNQYVALYPALILLFSRKAAGL